MNEKLYLYWKSNILDESSLKDSKMLKYIIFFYLNKINDSDTKTVTV